MILDTSSSDAAFGSRSLWFSVHLESWRYLSRLYLACHANRIINSIARLGGGTPHRTVRFVVRTLVLSFCGLKSALQTFFARSTSLNIDTLRNSRRQQILVWHQPVRLFVSLINCALNILQFALKFVQSSLHFSAFGKS